MRHRTGVSMTDRATIKREEQVDTGGAGGKEPLYDTVPVDTGVRCLYTPRQTVYERVDDGERTDRPAMVKFPEDVDVEEGDIITIEGETTTYEARGIERVQDAYRGRVVEQVVNLSRRD